MRFKSKKLIVLAIALCILLIVTIVGGSCTQQVLPGEEEEEEQQPEEYYLTGNLEDVTATILTDAGYQKATFSGAIGFRVVPGPKGELIMSLICLNLVGKGVPTKMGDSGVIGLALAEPPYKTTYDPSTGRITTEFRSTLHYELIDRIKGYREVKAEVGQDVLASYTEEMVGNLTGQIPKNLQVADGESTEIECDIDWVTGSSVIGSLQGLTIAVTVWVTMLQFPAQALRIQPVFIGSGPTDSDRTGIKFDELMTAAREVWDKCGTVRCLKFVVNDPIYLNIGHYRVLDEVSEAENLILEFNLVNAVEIFVVGAMDTYFTYIGGGRYTTLNCYWGGGVTFDPGTASARIVTSDQLLSVPCPCPCSDYFCPCGGCGYDPSTCGAVNLYSLAHELGHVLGLYHFGDPDHPDTTWGTAASIMGRENGYCCDDQNVQSAKNCRNATNPLLYPLNATCAGSPDIMD